MPRPTDQDMFLDILKKAGGKASNRKLLSLLCWEEKKYWRRRDEYVNKGLIQTGQGGSVRLSPKLQYNREEHLYTPLKEAVETGWGSDWEADELFIDVTARCRNTLTGKWSQPDLCAITRRDYKFQRRIDLWTFEVKPIGAFRVDHVHEAVSHSKYAHRTYIMFHIETESSIQDHRFKRCVEEAQRYKIGLVTFRDPMKYADWHWVLEAERREPSPENFDLFAEQLPAPLKEKLLRWA